jgi:prepilin-type N-terminal cleavage/methylation domain-containing protein
MKAHARSAAGFSLIELTVALGVAAFCLITVFGLIPVALMTQ